MKSSTNKNLNKSTSKGLVLLPKTKKNEESSEF